MRRTYSNGSIFITFDDNDNDGFEISGGGVEAYWYVADLVELVKHEEALQDFLEVKK